MPAPRIVPAVVREHAELAAFQWAQRDTLSQEDPPDAAVIAGIDKRLEANLDGLRIAGAAAWPFIIDQYEEYPEKGELFVAAVMALEQRDARRVEQTVTFARASLDARGFIGALAWLEPADSRELVLVWLGSPDPLKRWLGASALAEHGNDPGGHLLRLISDNDPRVRGRGYYLAAACHRTDAIEAVTFGLNDDDDDARFWAAWALAELGAGIDTTEHLKEAVLAGGFNSLRALRAVIKARPDAEIRLWLRGLLGTPSSSAVAVRAAGMMGDRSILAWLVTQMRCPERAQSAGAAFRELFPAANEDDLFTQDIDVLGASFKAHFGDGMPLLPNAAAIERQFLPEAQATSGDGQKRS